MLNPRPRSYFTAWRHCLRRSKHSFSQRVTSRGAEIGPKAGHKRTTWPHRWNSRCTWNWGHHYFKKGVNIVDELVVKIPLFVVNVRPHLNAPVLIPYRVPIYKVRGLIIMHKLVRPLHFTFYSRGKIIGDLILSSQKMLCLWPFYGWKHPLNIDYIRLSYQTIQLL